MPQEQTPIGGYISLTSSPFNPLISAPPTPQKFPVFLLFLSFTFVSPAVRLCSVRALSAIAFATAGSSPCADLLPFRSRHTATQLAGSKPRFDLLPAFCLPADRLRSVRDLRCATTCFLFPVSCPLKPSFSPFFAFFSLFPLPPFRRSAVPPFFYHIKNQCNMFISPPRKNILHFFGIRFAPCLLSGIYAWQLIVMCQQDQT